MKTISLLGSTGSIGRQTLEVARAMNYKIGALAVNSNVDLLESQIREFMPKTVAVFDENAAKELKSRTRDLSFELLVGIDGLCQAAADPHCDTVVNSVVGMVGLRPTLAAVKAHKTIALANKETLVAGGDIVMAEAKKNGVSILPVDSEHSAIFQSINAAPPSKKISKIILTASGGPFFGYNKEQLSTVTKQQALKHPNWTMGAKITIDSATLMNKGLEVIEAVHLFGLSPDDIEVVVHRESIVHSAIELEDGAVIAQLGVPDMKIPIQYALTYPDRFPCDVKRLSLTDIGSLTFCKPDTQTFECLAHCINAIKKGGLKPAAANGANEEAVKQFLNNRISFNDIGELVGRAVENQPEDEEVTLQNVLNADKSARQFVLSNIK